MTQTGAIAALAQVARSGLVVFRYSASLPVMRGSDSATPIPPADLARRYWRPMVVLALLPCLVSTYWLTSGVIHLIDPYAAMPPGTTHGAVRAVPVTGWILGTIALLSYWLAYVLLWRRSSYFALPYTLGAIARMTAWILMSFNPEFPQMVGFAMLGVDSAVLLLAMNWRTQLDRSKQRT